MSNFKEKVGVSHAFDGITLEALLDEQTRQAITHSYLAPIDIRLFSTRPQSSQAMGIAVHNLMSSIMTQSIAFDKSQTIAWKIRSQHDDIKEMKEDILSIEGKFKKGEELNDNDYRAWMSMIHRMNCNIIAFAIPKDNDVFVLREMTKNAIAYCKSRNITIFAYNYNCELFSVKGEADGISVDTLFELKTGGKDAKDILQPMTYYCMLRQYDPERASRIRYLEVFYSRTNEIITIPTESITKTVIDRIYDRILLK